MADVLTKATFTPVLDDEDLETILAIARNGQSGRITASEVRELVRGYRAFEVLYPALVFAQAELEFYGAERSGETYNSPRINAALAKARGEDQ